jgi:hypothetical protein
MPQAAIAAKKAIVRSFPKDSQQVQPLTGVPVEK